MTAGSGSPEMPYHRDRVKEIFRASETSSKLHGKLSDEMKALRGVAECEEQFREDFIWCLKHVMIVYERTPNVEHVIDFAAKFAVTAEDTREEKPMPEFQDGNVSISEENQPTTSEFLNYVFNFLLDSYEANDKAVRFRVCQLINKLLNHMGNDATIDDDLADRIYDCMLVRVSDKFPIVRKQAVAALARLQDPQDAECPVILSYLQIMQTDSHADVRRAALLNIALSSQTLPYIIERTRDVTEDVRKLAFHILAEKVNIRAFSIAQRLQLLQNGLCDTSEEVKKCANGLLGAWLKSLDGQVTKLLNCLHVESAGKTPEIALEAVFKELPKENLREHISALRGDTDSCGPVSIRYADLNCENALCWRYLAQHVKKKGVNYEEFLDELIPELSVFCKYIRGYVDTKLKSNWESDEEEHQMTFVLRQLLILAGVFDLTDEVGRKELCDLIRSLLVSDAVPLSLVNVLIDRYTDVQSDEDSRIQELVEIIADIRQPILPEEAPLMLEEKRQREIKMAGMRVKLNEYREQMQESVDGQEFSKAAELQQVISNLEQDRDRLLEEEERISSSTIREERDDPWTLEKCLTISCEMLQGISKPGLSPTLRTLAETLFLKPGIQNEDPQVRNVAVLCLGLTSLQSIEFAKQFMVLFLQVAQVDLELVRVTALKVIFDLLLQFGLEAFMVDPIPKAENEDSVDDTDEEEVANESGASQSEQELVNSNEVDPVESSVSKTVKQVLSFLTSLLDSESVDLRDVAAEGMAKLLLCGRVMSAKLLSSLVLLWCSPTTEDDCRLRHCLGIFFPTFACASRVNQELVEEAFLPTLKTLFDAPVESPLASVNINEVTDLFVALCNSNNLETAAQKSSINSGLSNIHIGLAMKIANEILSDAYCPYTRILCRVLTLLDLRGCDLPNVKDLKVLLSQLLENVDDSVALRSLAKFRCTLELLGTSPPTGETETTGGTSFTAASNESTTTVEESKNNGTDTDQERMGAVNNRGSNKNEQETAREIVNDKKELSAAEETDRLPLKEKDTNTPSMPVPSKTPKTRTKTSKRQGKTSGAQSTNRRNNNIKDAQKSPVAKNLDLDSCESGDEVLAS